MKVRLFVRHGRRHKPEKREKRSSRLITFKGDEGKRPRQLLAAAGAALALLLLASALRVEPSLIASAEVATVHDNGVLRVGVRTDMPKLALDGGGLEIELANRIAERILSYDEEWTGEQDAVELVPVSAMTVAAKLNDGSIDVAIAMMPENGSTTYAYSGAYYSDICRFVTRPGEGGRPIRDMKVGYLQSATTSGLYVPTSCFSELVAAYLKAHPEDGLVTTYNYNEETISYAYASYGEMFEALHAGEVDAIVLSDLYLDKFEGDYDFDRSAATLGTISYAVACSSSAPALATLADVILNDLREDGTLDALYRQYGL